jgi:hypothetical protein
MASRFETGRRASLENMAPAPTRLKRTAAEAYGAGPQQEREPETRFLSQTKGRR